MTRLGNVFILLIAFVLLSCQSSPDRMAHQDWADVTFYATGVGRLREWSSVERIRAIQAAKIDVAHQLEEKILAHRIDGRMTVFDHAKKGNAMKKIAAFVRGAELLSIENQADGVHIHARLFLGNHFKATLGLLPHKALSPSQSHPTESY